MMGAMDELKDMICRELEEIAEKGEMSAGELDTVYKLIVAKEKLLRIEELEDDLGYSRAGDWIAEGTYDRGGSYRGRTPYSRRSGRGGYSRARNYSMDDGKMMLVNQIRDMMEDPSLSSQDKNVLKKAMDQLQR